MSFLRGTAPHAAKSPLRLDVQGNVLRVFSGERLLARAQVDSFAAVAQTLTTQSKRVLAAHLGAKEKGHGVAYLDKVTSLERSDVRSLVGQAVAMLCEEASARGAHHAWVHPSDTVNDATLAAFWRGAGFSPWGEERDDSPIWDRPLRR